MQEYLKAYLLNIVFGQIAQHRGLTVLPIMASGGGKPAYLTMAEALEQNLVAVTEISQGGSVPELQVDNRADLPVLLLDGEELSGAKQNRVFNTTILLKEKSLTVVPVSCTEQGRWSYVSPQFADSGNVMSPSVRHQRCVQCPTHCGSGVDTNPIKVGFGPNSTVCLPGQVSILQPEQ